MHYGQASALSNHILQSQRLASQLASKIYQFVSSHFSSLPFPSWVLIKQPSEEGVGIKLSRGELTGGGLTPVTAAIKHQINRHKPSSPPHLAAPTNTKGGRPGWGQKTNHLS